MKHRNLPRLALLSLFLLPSCGDQSAKEEQGPDFDEAFAEAREKLVEPIPELLKQIEDTTKLYNSQRSKPDFPAEAISDPVFQLGTEAGKPGNSMLFHVDRAYIKEKDDKPMSGAQRALHNVQDILAGEAADFRPKTNPPYRVRQFLGMVEGVEDLVGHVKYVFLVRPLKSELPMNYGATFKPGSYEGQLLVYELGVKEPIARRKFSAKSSTTVRGKDFTDAMDQVNVDYEKNINLALEKAIRSVGVTQNYIPKIQFKKRR